MDLIVIPNIVYNNPKKVQYVVISLLSVKGDSDFTTYRSDRIYNPLFMLRKLGYYLGIYSNIRL